MPFAVLFVCTGNICRSPMAERLFQTRVGNAAPIVASSAGVSALVGWSMDPASAEVLQTFGGDPHGHVARRLTPELIASSNLILTAEASHRTVVLHTDPLAFRRTFTFREFARLGKGALLFPTTPSEQLLRDRVEAIAARRGAVEPAEPGADDIVDPFGAAPKMARVIGQQVSDSVDEIIRALGLAVGRNKR